MEATGWGIGDPTMKGTAKIMLNAHGPSRLEERDVRVGEAPWGHMRLQ